jgi:hypothetical protein
LTNANFDRQIIYITHCSAKKDSSIKESRKKVTPDKLYSATPTQRFMNRCIRNKVSWCIFSDKYGIWFPNVKNEWYEKNPDKVTDEEYNQILNDFNNKLEQFDEIWFYYNPGRFHKLYKKILKDNKLKDRIKLFTHLEDIK